MNKDKKQAILKAVTKLKKSQFGVTAIKVELEAQLDREINECDGYHDCLECNGAWEDATNCNSCGASGGFIAGEPSSASNHGDWSECEDCNGAGVRSCEYCDEGSVDCESYDCDGESEWTSSRCQQFILEELAPYGLSEIVDHCWVAKKPMVYCKFYNDGSVDSEFTFTILIDKEENALLIPRVIEAFNKLADTIGNEVDTEGAGMHIAVINDPDGKYPSNYRIDERKFINFKSSMQLLLPALYCLGTSSERSRSLDFRMPEITMNSHRAAVDYRGGALEYRIFDTCYDNPEHILDNLVVISNCMKYWAQERIPTGLSKIVNESIKFGNNNDNTLERFYVRIEHIDLLNQGLGKLKPCYYTITDIKKQRKLTINKRTLSKKEKEVLKHAEIEYKEYLDRFEWQLLMSEHKEMANKIQYNAYSTNRFAKLPTIEKEVKFYIEEMKKTMKSLDQYKEEKISNFKNDSGAYTLYAA